MIEIAKVRAYVGQVVKGVSEIKTVFPEALEVPFDSPFSMLGMPRVEPDVQACADRWTLPVFVGVAVGQTGNNAAAVVALEEAWPPVWAALQKMIADDPTLGGLVSTATIEDPLDFELLDVGGIDYPGQKIPLSLYG